MSSSTSGTSTGNLNVFSEAKEMFLKSLSPKERSLYKPCFSAEELIKHLESLEIAPTTSKRQLKRWVDQVRKFSDRLAPYLDAIGFIVQSHPEIAAITWGIIRMIFQVSVSALGICLGLTSVAACQ